MTPVYVNRRMSLYMRMGRYRALRPLLRPFKGWFAKNMWAALDTEDFRRKLDETEANYEMGRFYTRKVGERSINITPDIYEQLGRPEGYEPNPDWKDHP